MNVDKILVGVDFSECSVRAFEYALELSRNLGASMEVVHVVSPPTYVPLDVMLWGEEEKRYVERLKRDLSALVDRVAGADSDAIPWRVTTGVPYDVLITLSEEVDLVVIGTHGRTGLSHWVLGSVAERTLRFAHCPVLTVPLRGSVSKAVEK